jgi:DNA-binding transcriptional MerR regulator
MASEPAPVLLSAETAATYAGVRPATLRAWRRRYGLTPWELAGRNLYALDELAAVMERRARTGSEKRQARSVTPSG